MRKNETVRREQGEKRDYVLIMPPREVFFLGCRLPDYGMAGILCPGFVSADSAGISGRFGLFLNAGDERET